jgi:hypothetical protein
MMIAIDGVSDTSLPPLIMMQEYVANSGSHRDYSQGMA